MRFLIIPFFMFCVTWWALWTGPVWSNKKSWKRIGLITLTNIGAFILTALVMWLIIIFD